MKESVRKESAGKESAVKGSCSVQADCAIIRISVLWSVQSGETDYLWRAQY